MSWTDDRVELLKKLWGEGRTAAEIASELGGVTRNAVIGKAHRLKLASRVSPIQQNTKKPQIVSTPKQVEKKAPPSEVQAIVSPADAKRERTPMMDLGPRECRWPIGDPREKNFGFCGCRSVEGLPYCDEHAAAAYQAPSRSRQITAEDLEKEAERRAERAALNA